MMDKSFFYYLGLITQIGLVIATSIFIGLFVGMFIDNRFNFKGLFTIIFLIFGAIGGFMAAYELIKSYDRKI